MSHPDWIKPGQPVVVIAGRNNTPSPTLTIERVLKRDIVLSNGDRWSLARVAPDGSCVIKRHGSAWDPSSALFPDDARQVIAARHQAKVRKLTNAVVSLGHQMLDALRAERWDDARAFHERLGVLLSCEPFAPTSPTEEVPA